MITQSDNIDLLCGLVPRVVAQELVKRYPTSTELRTASEDELTRIRGIGKAAACRIQAALELSVRLTREVIGEKPILDSPDKVADLLREETRRYHVEHFVVCLLNTRRRLIKYIPISQGTLDSILVHPREVFFAAIEARAAAILLVHNHSISMRIIPATYE
jgi:DNA repair protein RadC